MLARQYQCFSTITVAGGSHVDALPEEALKSGIDIVVHGGSCLFIPKWQSLNKMGDKYEKI